MLVVVCFFVLRLSGWHLFVSGSGFPVGPNGLNTGLVQPRFHTAALFWRFTHFKLILNSDLTSRV
jgi:hypothetical protein